MEDSNVSTQELLTALAEQARQIGDLVYVLNQNAADKTVVDAINGSTTEVALALEKQSQDTTRLISKLDEYIAATSTSPGTVTPVPAPQERTPAQESLEKLNALLSGLKLEPV